MMNMNKNKKYELTEWIPRNDPSLADNFARELYRRLKEVGHLFLCADCYCCAVDTLRRLGVTDEAIVAEKVAVRPKPKCDACDGIASVALHKR